MPSSDAGLYSPSTGIPLDQVIANLRWTIEFESTPLKELKKLGSEPDGRITQTLRDRIATLDDPCTAGSALVGD